MLNMLRVFDVNFIIAIFIEHDIEVTIVLVRLRMKIMWDFSYKSHRVLTRRILGIGESLRRHRFMVGIFSMQIVLVPC